MFTSQKPRTTEEANFNAFVWELAWFSLGLAAQARFLQVYAIRLGAGDDLLNLMSALPALVLAISTGLGTWWLKKFPDTARALYLPALGMRFVFLLPAFAPFLPAQWRLVWLIIGATLPASVQGMSSVTFVVLMREAVPEKCITPLLSRRALVLNIGLAVMTVVFGQWLEIAPFPINYQVMFLAAFVFVLISLWELMQVKGKPITPEKRAPRAVSSPWRSPNFQRVALVAAGMHIAFTMIVPTISLHMVSGLGASEAFMGWFGLAELAAGAVASMFASRIVLRIGTRNMIALGMIGTALAAILIALAPALWVTLIGSALGGASWALAAMVGIFSFFTENTTQEEMPSFSVAYHQVLGLAMFIGPLLGDGIARLGITLPAVLLVGAAMRVAAGGIIWQFAVQPRGIPAQPQPQPLPTPAVGD
jgi:MFS family permease